MKKRTYVCGFAPSGEPVSDRVSNAVSREPGEGSLIDPRYRDEYDFQYRAVARLGKSQPDPL
jgi:hypothetical protein